MRRERDEPAAPRPADRPGTAERDDPRAGDPLQWTETSCGCPDCKAACLNSPGWFLPRELPPLARFLGLPVAEIFRRHLAIGTTVMPDGGLRHGVMPHKLRDHKKPGSVWTLPELAEPGRCVFYDRGRCAIYPVRPFECARMMHGRRPSLVRRLRGAVARLWTARALAPFEQLVGRPLAPGRAASARPAPERALSPRPPGPRKRR